MLPNKQKNQFYNPILQNRSHLKWIRNYVGENIPLFSIIVFSERCELKKVTVYSEDIKVIKRDMTYATVKSIWDKSPDVISDEKVEDLYSTLEKLTNVDEATKAAHIENIENKYKKPVAKIPDIKVPVVTDKPLFAELKPLTAEKLETQPEKVCPKCGSKLIIRTAKKGDNAGNQFYGCSGYPKCRYIENL